MSRDHAEDVLAIHGQGISTGNATFETRVPAWEEWDLRHRADCRLVAVRDNMVLGWAALSAVSTRPVYAGVAEVSVYVRAGHRGRGIGRQLLQALIAASEAARIWTLQSSVFPENLGTIRLHQSAGFRMVGRRERIGQMHGQWRDTLLLERRSTIIGCD